MKHLTYVYNRLCRELRISILSILIAPVCLTGVTLEVSTFSTGGVSNTGNITLNSSIGSLGGQSTTGTTTLRSGYAGQLFEIDSLAVEVPRGSAAEIADNATLQLSTTVTNTDGTHYDAADRAVWSSPDVEIDSTTAGLITPFGVAADTSVSVSSSYLGEIASLGLIILDVDKDNFITSPYNFAGDGIPDDWQLANFRPGSGSASPEASPALDGRVNYFKYYFVVNPLEYDLANVVSATVVDVGGNDHLAIQFIRAANVPSSIIAQVRFGDNVEVNENQRTGILHQSTDNGNGTFTEIYRDVAPVAGPAFSTVDLAFNSP